MLQIFFYNKYCKIYILKLVQILLNNKNVKKVVKNSITRFYM